MIRIGDTETSINTAKKLLSVAGQLRKANKFEEARLTLDAAQVEATIAVAQAFLEKEINPLTDPGGSDGS